jgi:hypothetical protein
MMCSGTFPALMSLDWLRSQSQEVATMPVAYFSETPNVDPATARSVIDAVTAGMGANTVPAGGRFHAEGPTDDGGWWTFDVWDSDEDWHRFRDDHLMPALRDAGVDEPPVRRLAIRWDTTQMPQSARS